MNWEQAISAPVDDRSNNVAVAVGPSKESHKYSSTDETREELGHLNFDHDVSYSDLTEDEIVRSLIEDQNDMHSDRLSRDISLFMDNYLMDNHSRDLTINTGSLSAKTKVHQKSVRIKPYNDPKYAYMINEIQNDLLQKLSKGRLLKSKQALYKKIPWKHLKREDVINWPNDVRLDRISQQGRQSLKKLYSNLDRMDFTKEFLNRYPKRRNTNLLRDELRSKLAIYFGNKLASRLEEADIRRIRIPWGKIKENDIINWPKNFKIGPLSSLPMNGLLALNELAKKDELNFSSEFLDLIRESLKKHKN